MNGSATAGPVAAVTPEASGPGAGSESAPRESLDAAAADALEFPPPRLFLWVIRDALEDTLSLATLADTARALGCTDLLVQVRGRGEAYYRSSIEPAPRSLEGSCPPGVRLGERPAEEALRYDPLAAACRIARAHGMRVHAWFNVFLTGNWSGNAPRNAAVMRPDWVARLRDGRRPDQLSRRERARAPIEGIYVSPGNPEVRPYIERVVKDLVRRYPLDGLHLDYIRYPHADAGYDEASREAFLVADLEGSLPPADSSGMRPWDLWRAEQVSGTVEALARVARSARPGIEITAAVLPDPERARIGCKQDWARWVREGWIDEAIIMAYTAERERFDSWLDAGGRSGRIVPGLGLHKLDARSLEGLLGSLRERSFTTYALFSNVELMRRRALRDAIRRSGGWTTRADEPGQDAQGAAIRRPGEIRPADDR